MKGNLLLLSGHLKHAIALLRSALHVGCYEHWTPQLDKITSRPIVEVMQPLNSLIPTAAQIIILDTNVARNLAHTNTTPPWAGIFAEMSRNNYSFSLADNAFAELCTQILSGSLTSEEVLRMKCRLETFLNKKLPIFPGKKDISALIGADEPNSRWSTNEILELSSRAWDYLISVSATGASRIMSANEELQSDREAWISIFEELDKCAATSEPLHEYQHSQLDDAFTSVANTAPKLSPSLSIRADLQIRLLWRQYVRSKKSSKAYNPTSPKKKNDGIDFDLYFYLYLPALIVTSDEGFFRAIKEIDSFQKGWFWKPDDLAQVWSNGKQPKARWPDEAGEASENFRG